MTATIEPQQASASRSFTARELQRLRELVRCVHCGAVPTEVIDEEGRPILREVGDGSGRTIMLPTVVTPHPEACPGRTNIGRPRNRGPLPSERVMEFEEAGRCSVCGKVMLAAKNRGRRTCSSTCRSRLAVLRRKGEASTPTETTCVGCSERMDTGPKGTRQYCTVECRNRAALLRRKGKTS
jgi:hypothetical protein